MLEENNKLMKNDFINYPHLFIVGVQRSGTTLLRLLLNMHSGIAIPEEGSFFMPLLHLKSFLNEKPLSPKKKRKIIQYLKNNSQFRKWQLGEGYLDKLFDMNLTMREIFGYLYYSFALKYKKNFSGDKTPSFIRKLNILSKAYPNAKFIHIVRDGRDVYLSFKKKRYKSSASVSVSAFEWRFKLFLINRALKRIRNRVIEIKYEDLLQEPLKQLYKICTFLGVPFEKEMLEFWRQSNGFIDNQHSELIFKPINPTNKMKWINNLTTSEIKRYEFFAKNRLKAYGYPIIGQSISFKEKAAFVADFILYLPQRILRIIKIAFVMRIASEFGLVVSSKYYE